MILQEVLHLITAPIQLRSEPCFQNHEDASFLLVIVLSNPDYSFHSGSSPVSLELDPPQIYLKPAHLPWLRVSETTPPYSGGKLNVLKLLAHNLETISARAHLYLHPVSVQAGSGEAGHPAGVSSL